MSFTLEPLREREGTEDTGCRGRVLGSLGAAGSRGPPELSCAWHAALQLPESRGSREQGCAWKSGAKSQNEQVLRRWEEEKLAAGECHSDIPRASRDTPCTGRQGWGDGRTARGCCLFLYACLAKYMRFFSGEAAQDGKIWQHRRPAKGEGLLAALLRATPREQRGPGGVCAGASQLSNPESRVL